MPMIPIPIERVDGRVEVVRCRDCKWHTEQARAYKVDTNIEYGEYFWEGLVISKDIIEHIPSAQKKGHWMPIVEANENGEPYQCGVYCSECGLLNTTEDNFCGECGADMMGEDDGRFNNQKGERRSGAMRFIICKKCKYNFEGECEFYTMGSGNDIDKPCRGEEELVNRAANDFIDAFSNSVMDNLRGECDG